MVSSSGMLVKSEFTSKLPMQKLLSCSTFCFANKKKSLTVNSLIVRQLSIVTGNLNVPIADNIGLKGLQASTIALWTLIHFLWLIWKFKVTEKSLLVGGLRFSLPPKKLNYAHYLTNFELFYKSIRDLDVLSNRDLDFVKTKIKDAALSSFHFYNANFPQNYLTRN